MRLAASIIPPLALMASPACSQDQLSDSDRAAAFEAAGFKQVAGQWRACEAPEDSIYTAGEIEQIVDLNGDGRPEAIITEGSTFCYGAGLSAVRTDSLLLSPSNRGTNLTHSAASGRVCSGPRSGGNAA